MSEHRNQPGPAPRPDAPANGPAGGQAARPGPDGQPPVTGAAPGTAGAPRPAQPSAPPGPQAAGQPGATPAGPGPASAPQPAAPQPAASRLTPADAATAAAAARAAQGPGPAPAQQQQPQQQRPAFAGAPAPLAAGGGANVPARAPQPAQPPVPLRPNAAPPAIPPGAPPPAAVRPPVPMAAPRRRHWMALVAFVLMVLVPVTLWGAYLWTRAEDQYISTVAFSVRKEEGGPSLDMLTGLSALGVSSGTASDTDILFEVIRSPGMVTRVGRDIDLIDAFTRAWPHDFLFAYDPSGTQEDLTDYWNRQVKVLFDDSAGIITVHASAFTPDDALQIAQSILTESEKVVNALSDKARDDATALADAELEKTRGMVLEARQAMTAFRVKTRILDPAADLGAQMAVLSTLQGQLAEAQVALDQLRENARPKDQRIIQGEQRIAALEKRIDEERSKFGGETEDGQNYAQLMQEYEKLAVDLEFAEGAHRSARVNYELALSNAQRQTRYLAAHIEPTAAEKSLRPDRPWLFGLGAGLALILWSMALLIYYSIRDRR